VTASLRKNDLGPRFGSVLLDGGKRSQRSPGPWIDDEASLERRGQTADWSNHAQYGVRALAFAKENIRAEEKIVGRYGPRRFIDSDIVEVDPASLDVFPSLSLGRA
jgi:hypothetical protein